MLKPEDLTTIPLFQGFDIKQIEKLLRFAEERSYNQGDFIFKQNEEAKKLYILEKGTVDIVLNPPSKPQMTIATETSGGVFGLPAIRAPHRYTADAKCLEPCQLLALDGEKVRELCYQEPDLGGQLMENLAFFGMSC